MRAIAKGGDRIDLDGNVAGAVTPEQATQAQHEIAARKARRAAKERAQQAREAAAEAKAASPPKAAVRASLEGLRASARVRRQEHPA
jgi:sRNA-binding protein